MSKNKTHDSWEAWGEYRKERSRLKDFEDWKQEALEELNMASVFIIINEWDTDDGNGSEIVAGEYYESESKAWDALRIIAESVNVTLPKDDTSFVVSDTESEYESYYIEELLRSDA